MAAVVNLWILKSEARVRSLASPCAICGGRRCTGTGFTRNTSICMGYFRFCQTFSNVNFSEYRLQSQDSPCGICDAQCATDTGFLRVFLFSFVSISPPVYRIPIHIHWSAFLSNRLSSLNLIKVLTQTAFSAQESCRVISALFWDITRRRVVIVYQRFGTTYRSQLHGSRVRVGEERRYQHRGGSLKSSCRVCAASERTPHRVFPGEKPHFLYFRVWGRWDLTTTQRSVISQKSADLIYIAAEAWIHAYEEVAHAFHCWISYVKKSDRMCWSLVIVCDSQFMIAR
jgi:hypothetical protein